MLSACEKRCIVVIRKKYHNLRSEIDSGKDVSLFRFVLQRDAYLTASRFEEMSNTPRPSCAIFEEDAPPPPPPRGLQRSFGVDASQQNNSDAKNYPNIWFSTDLIWAKMADVRRDPAVVSPSFEKC